KSICNLCQSMRRLKISIRCREIEARSASIGRASQGFVGIFTEQSPVILREAPELEESEFGCDVGHARVLGIEPAKRGMHRAQPLLAQEGARPDPKHVVKSTVQRPT